MTGLREMFEDLADGAPPSSRLIGDDLYAVGRQRHRRRTRLATGAAALALAVLAGGTGAVLTRGGPEPPGPAAGGQPLPDGIVQSFDAADAEHLYVTQFACTPGPTCPKTRVRLLGSDDGGRTWTVRGSAVDVAAMTVLGPRTLVAHSVGDAAPIVSTDGGRVWKPARPQNAVRVVPDGAALICWPATAQTGCVAHALDPAAGWFAPLTEPPALAGGYTLESVAGQFWATGTTPAGEPAVAVSTNAGGSWLTRVLDCDCERPHIATTADGRTGYVLVANRLRKTWVGYRLGGSGEPEWLSGIEAVRYDDIHLGQRSFVTADGTLVVAQVVRARGDIDALSFWGGRPGTSLRPMELDGLPSTVYSVRRAPDGWFYTHTYGPERGLYGSRDGRKWTLIAE
ncbi:hypothetical protein WEI85_41050 [Actinomycetes bacterium KLBMP 9797]